MSDRERRSEAELWVLLGEAAGLERVDLLAELADHKFEQRDYATAASLLESAAVTSNEIEDDGRAGEALDHRGAALFNDREFAAAAESYGLAAESFRKAGWDNRVPSALWGQADSLRRMGHWQEMLDVATNGIAFAAAEENGGATGSLGLQRARALYQLDLEEDALTECRRARDSFRKAGIPAGVAEVDDFGHQICMYLGRWDEALELATNCYVFAGTTRNQYDEAASELRLAETHIARQEFTEALAFTDRARATFKEHDDSVGMAKDALLRGQALQGLNRDDEALQAFIEGRVLFEANGYDFNMRECEIRRAILLHTLGRFMEAEAANRRIAEAQASAGLAVDEAWTIARRVDNLTYAEEWDKAVAVADEWYERVDSNDSKIKGALIRILANKGYAQWMLGEREAAFRVAEEALALTSEDEFDAATATLFEIRGRYLMDNHDRGARKELAHAVALHLAFGSIERARDLSTVFLPEMKPEKPRKEDASASEDRAHDAGGSI